MKQIVESKAHKVRPNHAECGTIDRGGDSGRLHCKTYGTELSVKKPFWFRFLLAFPELEVQSILGYLILPSVIIASYVLAFIYVALTVHSLLVWFILGCLLSPLVLVSASAKAHAVWRYTEGLTAHYVVDFKKALNEYIAAVKKDGSA